MARAQAKLLTNRQFCERLRTAGVAVETGRFGAMMRVESANDGPICILLDSKRTF